MSSAEAAAGRSVFLKEGCQRRDGGSVALPLSLGLDRDTLSNPSLSMTHQVKLSLRLTGV